MALYQTLLLLWFTAANTSMAFAPLSAVRTTHSFETRKTTTTTTTLGFFNFGKQQPEEPPTSNDTNDDNKDDKSSTKAVEEPDLIEKIFTMFFGAPEEAPLGLKRFDETRFPEQYPATTTDFDVEPVESDDRDTAQLRPLLKNTNLEKRGLRLTYDANRDGWNALTFHSLVDRQGPAVVVCQTRLGLVCGGYNPKGWVGYGEARGSIAAFLFRRKGGGVGGILGAAGGGGNIGADDWLKLKKVGGASFAQVDEPENGPSFGADSLVIPLGTSNSKMARSKLGSYYERMPDGGNSLFGKDAAVQLTSLKVYHGVWGEDEYIPYTDAEPFALY